MFSISNIYGFLVAIAVLGVLIFVHELGHFLVAKAMNFCVLKFSLGFGKKITGFVRGETEYLISAIPLGGYVKFYGENTMGTEEEVDVLTEEEKKRAVNVDDSRMFANIHPAKRILTVIAGPLFNLIFAAVLFSIIFINGFAVPGAKIGDVVKDKPADIAGIKAGDTILEIDGKKVNDWEDVHNLIGDGEEKTVRLKVKRDEETLTFDIKPDLVTQKNLLGDEITRRIVGIISSDDIENVVIKSFSVGESILMGALQTVDYVVMTTKGIVKLIMREIPLKENLGGPILIVQMTGEFAQRGLLELLNFMAIISISLGVINLAPIPILDGGAIVFFLVELLRGKPIGLKKRMVAQQIGLFLLIMLMLLAFYNDIARIIAS